MRIPRPNDPRETAFNIAADDASEAMSTVGPMIEQAIDVGWYEQPGTDVDRAAFALCKLRRAMAGQRGGPEHGDEAVRFVLSQATPEALVWIASRAFSYMDENGFPEAVRPWFPEEETAA